MRGKVAKQLRKIASGNGEVDLEATYQKPTFHRVGITLINGEQRIAKVTDPLLLHPNCGRYRYKELKKRFKNFR